MRGILYLGAIGLFVLGMGGRLVGAEEVDFSRDVRPILTQHCFKCHGPDEKQRTAGLRLDMRAGAVGVLKDGKRAIVPGKPNQSELVRRIMTMGAEIMPPLQANKPLSEAQKQTLKRWVASGAVYKTHWSFVPPVQTPLPKVKQTKWPRNPIDYFVLARLEKEGLKPSPEADRYTLARRVSLDLIGLPPTPEEADAFVKDIRPDAYERMVDRLLASPRYGERWARRWLDLARYADTNGYEKDRPRSVWPYRDWVIHALNADMPFNRFTIEQLAGDMLPNATLDQKIATGFHRNTMLNEEGGVDPQEYRFYAMTDRMATTGTAWLGLTIGCGQCHTHKFDPLTQKDYYRMMAFLNNADEPEMDVPKLDLTERRTKLEAEIAEKKQALTQKLSKLQDSFEIWEKRQLERAVHWTVLSPTKAVSNSPLLTILNDHSVLSTGDQTKRDVYDLTFATDLRDVTAIRLEALPDDHHPKNGPGRVYYEGAPGDFFLSEINLMVNGNSVKIAKASHDFASGPGASASIDGNPQTGWSVNGGQGKKHWAVFSLAQPLSAKELAVKMIFEFYFPCGIGRSRISVTTDKHALDAGLLPDVEETVLTPEEQRSEAQKQTLAEYYLSVAPEVKAERDTIKKLEDQLPTYPTTLVMVERPANNPRLTYLRRRGEYLQPAEQVTAAIPAFLPPLPKNTPANRLSFARWLVSPTNPLTGRVTVNRQWAAFFGKGIVTTTEDFGFQGQLPSHQELLDWLAIEFEKKGWSLKRLHRLIVMSATYRQSGKVTPLLKARDPQNRLLARGPRVRLEAELLRDSALTISGLLSEKMGGPSVFPPQPPGVTSEGTYGPLQWQASAGEDRYRRGLYTFSKRTAPYAMFTTFDAPSGEACVARREVSNTPLQALTLLNDMVFVETAQALGKKLASQSGTVEERITSLFRRCATRPPSPEERNLLLRFYETQKQRLTNKELDAAKIAGEGKEDVVERAAWTTLARSLLNLDEVIVKP